MKVCNQILRYEFEEEYQKDEFYTTCIYRVIVRKALNNIDPLICNELSNFPQTRFSKDDCVLDVVRMLIGTYDIPTRQLFPYLPLFEQISH